MRVFSIPATAFLALTLGLSVVSASAQTESEVGEEVRESDGNRAERRGAKRFDSQQSKSPRDRQQADANNDAAGKRTRSNRNNQSSDKNAAFKHFMAGYYAGYASGYDDGNDDLVLWIVQSQGESKQQADSRRNAEKQGNGKLSKAREALRQRMRSRKQMPSNGEMQEVTGTVLDKKTVSIRKTDVEHIVVQLKTDLNSRKIVDLGPKENYDSFQIKQGTRISAKGMPIDTPDFKILAARQVSVNGKQFDVEYHQPRRSDDSRVETDAKSDATAVERISRRQN